MCAVPIRLSLRFNGISMLEFIRKTLCAMVYSNFICVCYRSGLHLLWFYVCIVMNGFGYNLKRVHRFNRSLHVKYWFLFSYACVVVQSFFTNIVQLWVYSVYCMQVVNPAHMCLFTVYLNKLLNQQVPFAV